MSNDEIDQLERDLEHASAIAACSIGQPDRADNVRYREELRAKLETARASLADPRTDPAGD